MLLILRPHGGFADGFSPGACPRAALAGSGHQMALRTSDIPGMSDVLGMPDILRIMHGKEKGQLPQPCATGQGLLLLPVPRAGRGWGAGCTGVAVPPPWVGLWAGGRRDSCSHGHLLAFWATWQGSSESAQDGSIISHHSIYALVQAAGWESKFGWLGPPGVGVKQGVLWGPTAPPVPCHLWWCLREKPHP